MTGDPDLTVTPDHEGLRHVPDVRGRSFHLDTYCFDSGPEKRTFFDLVRDQRVQQVYFTGMLTHGQSAFHLQYIDPESQSVRSYYPDFVVQDEDGIWILVEVKGDHVLNDPTVLAKAAAAHELAAAGGMRYEMLPSTWAEAGKAPLLLAKGALQEAVGRQAELAVASA